MGVAIIAPLAMLLLTMGSPSARGGEYHSGANLVCSDCHTMHYSQSHAYDGGAADPLGAGGPFKYLLKEDSNELCKSCHDGQTDDPDVVGDHGNGYVRLGGGLTTGTAPYENWKGHTLGATTAAPGGTWTPGAEGLSCTNCHSQHGSASGATDVAGNAVTSQYRNLATRPGGISTRLGVSYAKGTNDLTKDIFMRGWTLGDLKGNYGVDAIDYNEPVTTNSGMSRWCQGCHTAFHGASTSANMNSGGDWLRHPTADANISTSTFPNRLYRVKVMSATGNWGTQGTAWTGAPADLTPTCTTCHKAHGNQNPFGLVYMKGDGPITEEGDAGGVALGMRTLCKQCHGQGGAY